LRIIHRNRHVAEQEVDDIDICEIHVSIEMLGGFTIVTGENRITERMKSSSKTLKLLQYLITYRHRFISRGELLEIFCDDSQTRNPGSSLRMLVSRIRTTLARNGFPCAEDVIVFKNGGYSWNNAVICDVDAEEFEAICKKSSSYIRGDEKLELLMQAARLYKGDFLPNSSDEMWVIPLAHWYRSMFLDCVHDALSMLTEKERYAEAEELCAKALRIDPFDEELISYHLRALLAQGRNADALDAYKSIENMFYDVLGIQFSENLRSLYSQIQRPAMEDSLPLEAVISSYLDGADIPGAYFCDFSVFTVLCKIESRSIARSRQSVYIVRIDTKHEPGAKSGGVMKQLGAAIAANLRMGDLFTRASPSQYMLMLRNLTFEDCESLIARIMHALDSKFLPDIIRTSIKAVMPTY